MKIKAKHVDADISNITNVWQLIAYILRFCKMELIIIILILSLVSVIILNVNYSKKEGVSITPTTKIEVKK